MKKKIILSVVAGAALLMANPLAQKADAASNTTQAKVYYYQSGNLDQEQINEFIKKYFSNYQKSTTQKEVEAPKEEQTQIEQQPATEKPATGQPAQQQPSQTEETNEQASYQLSQYEQQVVDLTNQERAKQGLPALKVDLDLSKVAREKSLDMQKNNYFSHTSPTYGSPFDMMKQFGISYKAAGENIAKGQRTPQEVVNAWMNSSGHRQNILSSNFTHIGVGYVAEGNYWTQQFIGK
ncbi:CAP domain-containing protein [Metabacillus halosaccharovorans]|uniref:CAP domain-containing protein n=1 Tax=Metabacillus halosaccharovorans TaxID=930124 RepID=UPI001C1F644E|nr:CAP domain-containing protein [Metabacillus halosaccharovorans]MBU7594312.1 sporulation protein [Metabacillus halosaccharovorans]